MSISKEEYVSRIASASPLRLVIINYEIILNYLEESKKYIDTTDIKFDFNIRKARQFLAELRSSLNKKYEISLYLLSLYNYIDKQLAMFLFNKNISYLEEVINILNNLLEGFNGIEDFEEDKSPIMENTQSIYAGLTYDKNGKLEEFVYTSKNRGFKA